MTSENRWIPVYVGLGSNLDNPRSQVSKAVESIAELRSTQLVAVSHLYQNPPMGPQDQPDYVNAVAGLLTQQSAREFLLALQALERSLGRVRTEGDRWGPRKIDLDLLVYGSAHESLPDLILPHPGILERNFVLFPLCDIAPELLVPGQGCVSNLARQLGGEGLERIEA